MMDAFSIYIPMDRRRALAQNRELPNRMLGAALFADISGFTPLTEALVREFGQQRGAEELTRQLNQVYHALINELHRYQGSVISFSGDAITCWFDEDDGTRATTCALVMQEVMQSFEHIRVPSARREMPDITVSLAMKAAVVVGPARRFVVGDPQIQLIDVLAGVTLEHLAAAEHHANKGEVVVDEASTHELDGLIQIADWRTDEETGQRFAVVSGIETQATILGASSYFQQPLEDEKVRPWLLPPVYERLHRGQGDFLAELRPAVALFIRFGGIDYDQDEEAGQKLDAYIRWLQKELREYDGYLLQLTVGDKGSYIMAAMGAPIAHEDDPVRAVSAALKLINLPDDLRFIAPVQIGVAMGRTRTGAYGGVYRRTYGVMGDDVNLAARLMQAAPPGHILVSEAVRQATRGNFTWESLPPMKVKGKAEPVNTFRPVGTRQRRSFRLQVPEYALPMVGREAELERATGIIAQAQTGQGQILALVGEAGLGKTRLVTEIIQAASARGIIGLGGECESFGTETSYLVWRGVWNGFFDIDPSISPGEQIETIRTQLDSIQPGLSQRLPLLEAVLNIPIPDNELTQTFDAKLRKTSLEALLVTCLQARAKEKPLLIVLEDCQWIDSLSHELLETIGRTIIDLPVVIVATMRPPEVDRVQNPRVSLLPNYQEIRLKPFESKDAETLIQAKVTQKSGDKVMLPSRLTERIIKRADGNPFYLEELLNYLFEQKDTTRTDVTLELPTSLHSLIISRLDQLTENEKTIIKVASVIGRLFRVALLWGTYPELGEYERVQIDLQALQRMQLTALDPSEPELAYFFRQIVTQEVTYESLPFETRANLHCQLARYVEQNYVQSLEQFVDLLAFHYLRGQDWEKAMRFNLLAAKAAQREFANEAAIAASERVLDSAARLEQLDTSEARTSVHEILGEVLTLTGQYDEALENLATARALVAALPSSQNQTCRLSDLCRKIAAVYERKSEYDTAFEWLEKGLDYLNADVPTIEAARIYLLGAGLYHRQGKNQDAIGWSEKSIALTSQIQTQEGQRVMAQTSYLLGGIHIRLGALSDAIQFCRRSLETYQEIDDIVGQARAYNNLGIAYSEQGDWNQSSQAYQKSLEINQQIGNIQEQGFVANNLANIYLYRGEWEEAVKLFRESNNIWSRLGAALPDAVTKSNLAQVYIYQKNWEEAQTALQQSEEIFHRIGSDDFMPELERRWAEYFLGIGATEQALEHIQRSLQLAIAQEATLEAGMSNRVLGMIQMAKGDRDEAERVLRQSLQTLLESNSEYEAAKTRFILAQLLINQDRGLARQELSLAIHCFEKLDAKADLNQAQELINSI